uniref:FCP1 homology domain-containing protein n=1 Tax=Physcomitrium patens TaxID=3218 RepID=A0A2K1KGS2_PHYPA|nr:hypothetical protein PHYPA_009338 [Physcomitrium patens]
MEDIKASLSMYLDKLDRRADDDDETDPWLIYGTSWKFFDPEELEAWSLAMIPFTHNIQFLFKFKKSQAFLKLTTAKRVKDVEYLDGDMILVKCVTIEVLIDPTDEYHFTVLIPSKRIPFTMSPFLESLEPTEYSGEKDGSPAFGKWLCTNINLLLQDFSVIKGKLEAQKLLAVPRSVWREVRAVGGSQASVDTAAPVPSSSRGKAKPRSSSAGRGSTRSSPIAPSRDRRAASGSSQVSEVQHPTLADAMTDVPSSYELQSKPDFKYITAVYKKFWSEYKDAYNFGVNTKKGISIDKLIDAPTEFNIQSKEDKLVDAMVVYLMNLPDRKARQTLYVMPTNRTSKPTTWEEIKDGDRDIIDESNVVDDDVKSDFRIWSCFIVWLSDPEILRSISAYYNWINHFQMIQPSWATNMLGARSVWVNMGCPENPSQITAVGMTVGRRALDIQCRTKGFKAFEKAMTLRFSLIDVNKSLRISRTKGAEEKLKLVNELKIITAPEPIYNLWSEVISSAAQGELYNPDTSAKFNEKENWKQESCMLSHEYFKWLGNLSLNDLERLMKHLLNQCGEKRKFSYPKVTIKSILSVLESCYSTKDWVERRKRKQLVKKELDNIDPSLGLINAEGDHIHEDWKAFKTARNITSASIIVLLERPGESYFAEAKQLKSKNKTCMQISPAAVEFLKVFLNHKNGFQVPYACAYYKTYDVRTNTFSKWKDNAWNNESARDIGLGIIDLRELPGVEDVLIEQNTVPYFHQVLAALEKNRSPYFTDGKRWLFISGCESHRLQTMDFINSHEAFKGLHIDFADYIPAKFEHLGDSSVGRVPRKVILTFLQDVDARDRVEIRPEFLPPDTPMFTKPHGYNELEFRVYNTELRMEFYLWLVRKFCRPGGVHFFTMGGRQDHLRDNESDRWEEISRKALTLDRDDFLPSGYKVSAIYKSMATTPTRSRVGARLSDRFESSPSKKRRTTPIDDVLVISNEDDDKGDDHDYDPDEEKKVDEKIKIDDDDLQELDPIQPNATLPERRSRVILQSAQASDNPPSSGTPGASSSGGRRRKRKDMDSVATVMESISAILADSQRRHEQQIAEINAREDRDRAESMRLFEESRRMHEDTSRMMLQLNSQLPDALPAPPSQPPSLMLGNAPSRSVMSGSSSGHAEAAKLPHSSPVNVSGEVAPTTSQQHSPTSPAINFLIGEVSRVEAASVEPHSMERPTNLEDDTLEIAVGSDELAFPDPDAGDEILATLSAPSASPSLLFYPTSVAFVVSVKSLPESRTMISDSRSESFVSSKQKVSDPPVRSEGPLEDLGRPLKSRAVDKWLNVVLDLNGILCVCEDWKSNRSTKQYSNSLAPHSATIGAIVAMKAVYVRPNCLNFLAELGKIARISVWSSMKSSNIQGVVNYLFPKEMLPGLVLGQDSCTIIRFRDSSGRLTTFMVPRTHKELFLKNLDTLFSGYKGIFNSENTIIVDDSPLKHIMNDSKNALLPNSWSNDGNGNRDTFLLRTLLPWFQRLHLARDQGLKLFREHGPNRIGQKMLCDERNCTEYNKVMELVRGSSPNFN